MNTYCDTCPARASHLVSRGGYDLSFCQHHTNKFEERLTREGWAITKLEEDTVTELVELADA